MPRFVKLASLSDLPPGSALEVDHEGRLYAIFHRPDGRLFATPTGGPVNPRADWTDGNKLRRGAR